MVSLTLVVPTFNEAHRWSASYWEDLLLLEDVRWIFVDDGSTDDSHELLTELSQPSKYQILRFTSNRGKGEAVRAGMNHFIDSISATNYDGSSPTVHRESLLGFLDADGSIGKADIIELLEIAKSRIDFEDMDLKIGLGGKVDTIWASRVGLSGRRIERRLSRHYLGRVINSVLGNFIPSIPYDPQCGLKIFRPSSRLKASLATPFKTRWFFDLEIMFNWEKANKASIRIWEHPLDSWHEIPGSHLSFRNFFGVAKEMAQIAIDGRKLTRDTERGKEIGS